jgi:glycosyltransferase involved in cell wall biosynthesis
VPRHVLVLNERDLDNPRAGGAEIHLFEIFGRLAAAGDRVTMLCAGFPGGAAEATIAGVHVRRLGENRFGYYTQVVRACRAYIARERPDVLVEALNKMPFLSPLYTRIPLVAVVHHLFGTTAFQQVPAPVAAAVVSAEWLIPRLYRRATFVAISDSSRDDMVKRGIPASAIRVVLCGVDHARYRPDPAVRDPRALVVFVGRLERYKRLDVLLDAIALVRRQGIDAHAVIAGTGDALEEVRAQVRALRLEACVEVPGFVDEAEKVRLLQAARVAVQPSEKEGWGLTVIEANACGTPCVATAVPGLRDSVRDGETGLLVPVRDAAALADGLARVLGDEALRASLAAGALAWAARFRWEDAAAAVGETLDEACGRAYAPVAAQALSLKLRAPGSGG